MLKDECSLKNVKFWLAVQFHTVVKKIEGYFKKKVSVWKEEYQVYVADPQTRVGGQETRILNSRIE